MSASSIRDASGVPKSSLHRALNRLVDRGFLTKDATGSYPRFQLTPDGLAQTVPDRPNPSHGTASNRPVPPPPLKGWDTGRNDDVDAIATPEQEALIARHLEVA